jgi:hypothetical protein
MHACSRDSFPPKPSSLVPMRIDAGTGRQSMQARGLLHGARAIPHSKSRAIVREHLGVPIIFIKFSRQALMHTTSIPGSSHIISTLQCRF